MPTALENLRATVNKTRPDLKDTLRTAMPYSSAAAPVSNPPKPVTVQKKQSGLEILRQNVANIGTQKPVASKDKEVEDMIAQVNKEVDATKEKKPGLFDSILDTGIEAVGTVAKAGLDFWNHLEQRNAASNFKMRELLYGEKKIVTDPKTGKPTLTTQKLDAYNTAKTPEEKWSMISNQEQKIPLVRFLNSPTGQKMTRIIGDKTANLPLKAIASFKAIGDETYNEAYKALEDESRDPNNPRWQKLLYGVQDSGAQSLIGVALSMATSILTKSPAAGNAVSLAYFGTLSAEEQRQERGKVDNVGNIVIDSIGDTILSDIGETILKTAYKEGAKEAVYSFFSPQNLKRLGISTTKGFTIEGGTEVAQSFLKLTNDYGHARTEEEKRKVIDQMKNYMASGAMVDEFLIGGISGAIITGGSEALGGGAGSINPGNRGLGSGANEEPPKVRDIVTEAVKEDDVQKSVGRAVDLLTQGKGPASVVYDLMDTVDSADAKLAVEKAQGIIKESDNGDILESALKHWMGDDADVTKEVQAALDIVQGRTPQASPDAQGEAQSTDTIKDTKGVPTHLYEALGDAQNDPTVLDEWNNTYAEEYSTLQNEIDQSTTDFVTTEDEAQKAEFGAKLDEAVNKQREIETTFVDKYDQQKQDDRDLRTMKALDQVDTEVNGGVAEHATPVTADEARDMARNAQDLASFKLEFARRMPDTPAEMRSVIGNRKNLEAYYADMQKELAKEGERGTIDPNGTDNSKDSNNSRPSVRDERDTARDEDGSDKPRGSGDADTEHSGRVARGGHTVGSVRPGSRPGGVSDEASQEAPTVSKTEPVDPAESVMETRKEEAKEKTGYTNDEISTLLNAHTAISNTGEISLIGTIPEYVTNAADSFVPAGGLEKKGAEGRGLLDEYYTPGDVTAMVGTILDRLHVYTPGMTVLEPSAGTGAFLDEIPMDANMYAHEINPVAARALKVRHPLATVSTRPFEDTFITDRGQAKPFTASYDLVIGNPPYGTHRGTYKGLGEEKNIAKYEEYFIKRALDLTKDGGYVAMVVPSGFLRSGKSTAKTAIGKMAILKTAYRLPNGSFDTTDIGTDIVVFRKTPGGSGTHLLENDAYFAEYPEYILGTQATRSGKFGEESFVQGTVEEAADLFYKQNERIETDTQRIADHGTRFESLPEAETYVEEKAQEYGSREAFLNSQEYAVIAPEIEQSYKDSEETATEEPITAIVSDGVPLHVVENDGTTATLEDADGHQITVESRTVSPTLKTDLTDAVRTLEKDIQQTYLDLGNGEYGPTIEETSLTYILTELENAEAGERIFLDHDGTRDSNVLAVPSTFPSWIPEASRTRADIERLYQNIHSVSDLHYPTTATATNQRALFDAFLAELDFRSGVDTSAARAAIMLHYEQVQNGMATVGLTEQAQSNKAVAKNKKVIKTAEKDDSGTLELSTLTNVSEDDLATWRFVSATGELVGDFDRSRANVYNGEYYNDFNYLQGDIYEKIDQLEKDKGTMDADQYEKQKTKLTGILPEPFTVDRMHVSPNTAFAQTHKLKGNTLADLFVAWLKTLPRAAFGESNQYSIKGYVENTPVRGGSKEQNEADRKNRRIEGDRLFRLFLTENLDETETADVERAFNRAFNSYVRPDYSKVPLLSKVSATYPTATDALNIKPIQQEGISFLTNKGVGLIAHDVGVGKSMELILAINESLHRGWSKRPLLVVPSAQVYEQMQRDILKLIPGVKLNLLSNLGAEFKGDLASLEIADKSFSLITYEGFERLGFKPETYDDLTRDFLDAVREPTDMETERTRQKNIAKAQENVAKGIRGTTDQRMFEDLGFDLIAYDEVHNANHIIEKAKMGDKDKTTEFRGLEVSASNRGLKLWLASQYILKNNSNRNVYLASATPFTNHPLEYYSVLSLMARERMQQMGIRNVNDFMAMFMELTSKLESTASGNVKEKTEVRSFKNYQLFRKLLTEFIDFRDGEEAGVKRPNRLNRDFFVKPNQISIDLVQQAQTLFDNKEIKGGTLTGIGELRKIALSPYLSSFYQGNKPTYKQFVKNSPKLLTLVKLIKQTYDNNNTNHAPGGQLVYSPIGEEAFHLVREYLIKETGFQESEVELITGKTPKAKRPQIQERFNKGIVKVVLGSDAIKEGVNLQENTTDLYILSLPWNFTQLRQVHGRAWRQGNRWQAVRVNNLYTEDSIDVFLSQKLQNKQKRYASMLEFKGDVLDIGDVDFEELKNELITDPVVRVHYDMQREIETIRRDTTRLKADAAYQERRAKEYLEVSERAKTLEWHAKNNPEIPYYREEAKKVAEKLRVVTEEMSARGIDVATIEEAIGKTTAKVADMEAKLKTIEEERDARVKAAEALRDETKAKAQPFDLKALLQERAEDDAAFFAEGPTRGLRARLTNTPEGGNMEVYESRARLQRTEGSGEDESTAESSRARNIFGRGSSKTSGKDIVYEAGRVRHDGNGVDGTTATSEQRRSEALHTSARVLSSMLYVPTYGRGSAEALPRGIQHYAYDGAGDGGSVHGAVDTHPIDLAKNLRYALADFYTGGNSYTEEEYSELVGAVHTYLVAQDEDISQDALFAVDLEMLQGTGFPYNAAKAFREFWMHAPQQIKDRFHSLRITTKEDADGGLAMERGLWSFFVNPNNYHSPYSIASKASIVYHEAYGHGSYGYGTEDFKNEINRNATAWAKANPRSFMHVWGYPDGQERAFVDSFNGYLRTQVMKPTKERIIQAYKATGNDPRNALFVTEQIMVDAGMYERDSENERIAYQVSANGLEDVQHLMVFKTRLLRTIKQHYGKLLSADPELYKWLHSETEGMADEFYARFLEERSTQDAVPASLRHSLLVEQKDHLMNGEPEFFSGVSERIHPSNLFSARMETADKERSQESEDAFANTFSEEDRDMIRKDMKWYEELTAQSHDMYMRDPNQFEAAKLFEQAANMRRMKKAALDQKFSKILEPYFKLNATDRTRVDEILHEGDENGEEYQNLKNFNLTVDQAQAYFAVRTVFNTAHELMLTKMREAGVPEDEIEEFKRVRTGYMPHKWPHRYAVKTQEYGENGWETKQMDTYKTEKESRKAWRELVSKKTDDRVRYVLDTLDNLDVDFFTEQRMSLSNLKILVNEAKTSDDVKNAMLEAFRNMVKEKGFGRQYLRRSGVRGYETKETPKQIADYISGLNGFLTKMEAGQHYFAALEKVDARRQKKFYTWLRNSIAYDMGSNDDTGRWVNKVAYTMMLASDISYLVTNATQNFVVGTGELSKYLTGKNKIIGPEAYIMSAMKDWATQNITDSEKSSIEELTALGRLSGEETAEYMSFKNNTMYSSIGSWINKALYQSTSAVERHVNRVPMFLASRRVFMAEGMNEKDANNKALSVADDVHFRYGRQHRAEYERGLRGIPFIFTHYIRSMIYLMLRNAGNNRMALARQLAYTAILGGTRALPFAALVMWAWRTLMEEDGDDDEKKELGRIELAIQRGIPALYGVDLSGRVSIELFNINSIIESPDSMRNWLGASGGLAFRMYNGTLMLTQKRYEEALGKLMPDVLGNIFKAHYGYNYGVYSSAGEPLLGLDGDVYQYNTWEAIIRGTGFTPTQESILWDAKSHEWELSDKVQAERTKVRRTVHGMMNRGDFNEARAYQAQAMTDGTIDEDTDYIREFGKDTFVKTAVESVGQGADSKTAYDKLVQELYGDTATDRQKNNIRKEFKVYLEFGMENSLVNDLLSAKSNDQRVEMLKKARAGMTEAEWDAFVQKARSTVTLESGKKTNILISDELADLYRKAK